MARGPAGARAELIISIGVLLLGVGASVVAWSLPEAGGYARVGPNVTPKIVAAGLFLLGIWLLAETFTGGYRSRVPDDPTERGEHPFLLNAFLWVSAGLIAQMVLIGNAGFVIAGGVLFACIARGFGSTRWLRDVLAGLVLALFVFLFFVRFLNVNLPAGWLKPLLGAAGI
jgi:putative tricarboxylic transport membrane protein